MSRLIRMDTTGHSTLAEWTAADGEAVERAAAEFRAQLDAGYYAMVTEGEGKARQRRGPSGPRVEPLDVKMGSTVHVQSADRDRS